MIHRQPFNPRSHSTDAPSVPTTPAPHLALTDFARRTVVAVLIALLFGLIAVVCWRGVHVLLETFAGLLFALFLYTLSDWLSRHTQLRYGWSLAVVVVALFVLIGGLGFLLGNRLAIQIESLSQTLPKSIDQVQEYLGQYPWGRVVLEHLPETAQSLTRLGPGSPVTGLFSG